MTREIQKAGPIEVHKCIKTLKWHLLFKIQEKVGINMGTFIGSIIVVRHYCIVGYCSKVQIFVML